MPGIFYTGEFYCELVYKLTKIVCTNNFAVQFIKIISHYKKIEYNINVLLGSHPITVDNFPFLFSCTQADLSLYEGSSNLKTFLKMRGLGPDFLFWSCPLRVRLVHR